MTNNQMMLRNAMGVRSLSNKLPVDDLVAILNAEDFVHVLSYETLLDACDQLGAHHPSYKEFCAAMRRAGYGELLLWL